jgi:hypothetical protein
MTNVLLYMVDLWLLVGLGNKSHFLVRLVGGRTEYGRSDMISYIVSE